MIPKNVMKTERPQMTSQYGECALHAGIVRLHAFMRNYTPTRPGTYMRARTHAHTDEYKYDVMLFRGKNDSRTRLSVTLYVHCVSCLFQLLMSVLGQDNWCPSVVYTESHFSLHRACNEVVTTDLLYSGMCCRLKYVIRVP